MLIFEKSSRHTHYNFYLYNEKLEVVSSYLGVYFLYGELGRTPLLIIRKIHMFRYWTKLLKTDNNSVIKRIYCMLKNDADNNVSYNNNNWAYQITLMLQNLG